MKLASIPRVALATLAVSVSALLPWAASAQTLVPAGSEIAFTSKQMGVPVDGKFGRYTAQIAFDPKKPEAGHIAFNVDLASVNMGAPESEAELTKPGWFDSKRVAAATFQSSSIKAAGPNKFTVTGKLTIKGNVRDVVVPVTLAPSGATTTASGAFTIKRLEFKIGDGEWGDTSLVADEVQVRFKLVLAGMAAS